MMAHYRLIVLLILVCWIQHLLVKMVKSAKQTAVIVAKRSGSRMEARIHLAYLIVFFIVVQVHLLKLRVRDQGL